MTRARKRAAGAVLSVAAIVASSGGIIGGPYWVGSDQCVVHFGPMEPSPNGPPDVYRQILGDLIYEVCWTAEY